LCGSLPKLSVSVLIVFRICSETATEKQVSKAAQENENGQVVNLTGTVNQQFTSASGTYAAPVWRLHKTVIKVIGLRQRCKIKSNNPRKLSREIKSDQ